MTHLISADIVRSWFDDTRPAAARLSLGTSELNRLTRLVSSLAAWAQRPRKQVEMARTGIDLDRLARVQRATMVLLEEIPILQEGALRVVPAHALARTLRSLLVAAEAAADPLGRYQDENGTWRFVMQDSKRPAIWHEYARQLAGPIREVWRSAGLRQASLTNSEGPALKVMIRALAVILAGHPDVSRLEIESLSPATVRTYLRRNPPRRWLKEISSGEPRRPPHG